MSDPKYKTIGHPAVRLMEECAELIQAASKGHRFGWDKGNPFVHPFRTNLEALKAEFADVQEALAEVLKEVE